jgi:hypothetical protein
MIPTLEPPDNTILEFQILLEGVSGIILKNSRYSLL